MRSFLSASTVHEIMMNICLVDGEVGAYEPPFYNFFIAERRSTLPNPPQSPQLVAARRRHMNDNVTSIPALGLLLDIEQFTFNVTEIRHLQLSSEFVLISLTISKTIMHSRGNFNPDEVTSQTQTQPRSSQLRKMGYPEPSFHHFPP